MNLYAALIVAGAGSAERELTDTIRTLRANDSIGAVFVQLEGACGAHALVCVREGAHMVLGGLSDGLQAAGAWDGVLVQTLGDVSANAQHMQACTEALMQRMQVEVTRAPYAALACVQAGGRTYPVLLGADVVDSLTAASVEREALNLFGLMHIIATEVNVAEAPALPGGAPFVRADYLPGGALRTSFAG